MKTIFLKTDVAGELTRAAREVANHRSRPILLVFPEIRHLRGERSADLLAEILTADAQLSVLLTRPIPEEVGLQILDSGCSLYVMENASLGSPDTVGTELSAIGAATLVETVTHAEEIIRSGSGRRYSDEVA